MTALILALVAVCAAQTTAAETEEFLESIPAGRTSTSAWSISSGRPGDSAPWAAILGEVLIRRDRFPALPTGSVELYEGGCTPVPTMEVADRPRSARFTLDQLPGTRTVDALLVTAVAGYVATSSGARGGGTQPAVILDGFRVR